MSWISNLAHTRPTTASARSNAPASPSAARVEGRPGAEAKVDPSLLGLGLSEKVLAAHGANLRPSAPTLRTIAELATAMPGHRAMPFGHALDGFYAGLSRTLSSLPEADRARAAATSSRILLAVVERVGTREPVLGAVTVLSSLLFSRLAPREDFSARLRAVEEEVEALLDSQAGRRGAGTALFGYRHLVEDIEARFGLRSLAERRKVWAQVRAYLAEAGPRAGLDQGGLADLTGYFEAAVRIDDDPIAALDRAKVAAWAGHAGERDATRAILAQRGQTAEGTVARQLADTLDGALEAVLDASPSGPASLFSAVTDLGQQLAWNTAELTEAHRPAIEAAASVVRAVTTSPLAGPVLEALAASFVSLVRAPTTADALGAVKSADDVPLALLRAHLALRAEVTPELEASVERLARLPGRSARSAAEPSDRLRAALAVLDQCSCDSPLEAICVFVARAVRTMETSAALETAVRRFAEAFEVLGDQVSDEAEPMARPDVLALATAVAEEPRPIARYQLFAVRENAALLRKHLPSIDLGALARCGKDGAPGLAVLELDNRQGRAAGPLLEELLVPIAAAKRLGEPALTALVRKAMHSAHALARLDRDPKLIIERVAGDWALALEYPKALTFADRPGKAVAVRAGGQDSVLAFFDAHPELPPEAALTFGCNLSGPQLTWLVGQLGQTRDHRYARVLRDATLAAIEAGRLDLLDAARTTRSSPRVVAATLAAVADDYRQQRLEHVPFERFIEGLRAGRDSVAEVQEEQTRAALDALGLGEANGVARSAEGEAALRRNLAPIQAMLAYLGEGNEVYAVDAKHFREPLLACLRSVGDGTWPKVKYDDEVGRRQLAGLSPEQVARWAETSSTSAPDDGAARPELDGVGTLARGLVKALPAELRLGPGLAWDQASLDRLVHERTRLLDRLHAAPKGSAEHRASSRALGPVDDRAALLELHQALAQAADLDPERLLSELQPLLARGAAAARKLGGKGTAEALRQLAELADTVSPLARRGLYAVDEHSPDAYLTSFGGESCINALNGFNRASIVEFMASACYKMGRLMRGDQCVGRTLLRLVPIDHGDYHGHALRMDQPLDPKSPYTQPAAREQELMYAHGLAKAIALGVPFLYGSAYGDRAAEARGLVPEVNQAITIHTDYGHTGLHHNQGFEAGPYFVSWPPLVQDYSGPTGKDGELSAETHGHMKIVYPPR